MELQYLLCLHLFNLKSRQQYFARKELIVVQLFLESGGMEREEKKKAQHLLRVEVEQVKIFRFWKAVLQRVDVFQIEPLAAKMEH